MEAVNTLFNDILTDVKTVALAAAVLMIAWSGILYATSAGSAHQVEKAKLAFIFAVVGVCIVFLAAKFGDALHSALPG